MEKRILVTGASKAIGRAIAVQLGRDGFSVTAHCHRDTEGATETVDAIKSDGGTAQMIQFDVSTRDQCREVLEHDVAAHGAYYGVVLNAGIAQDAAFPAMSDEAWDAVLATNLDGFYNVLHPLIMPMVRARAGGRIVAMSSISGLMGNRGQVNYSASKAGLIGAVKSLAIELAKRKITVNCVAPGLIDTEMIQDLPLDEVLAMVPMRRVGTPEEVAALVGFLASDKASYITRQVISVNGGMA